MGRSRADAAHFTSLFKNKHVTKQYWAVLAGVPNPRSGRLAVPLKELGQGMGVAANMQGERLSLPAPVIVAWPAVYSLRGFLITTADDDDDP
jgi:hypothetical protein